MKRVCIAISGLLIVCLSGVIMTCGDDDSSNRGDAATQPDGATGADADQNGSDGSSPGPDAGPDAGPAWPYCYKGCNNVADCDLGNSLHDPDNYECDNGLCRWQGCNSTAECFDVTQDPDKVCDTIPGYTIASCYESCSTPADCVWGNSTLYDADNYQCVTGLCHWIGCNSSAECEDAFLDTGYQCGTVGWNPVPSCYKSCGTAADCVLGSSIYDADNYLCTGGLCEWIGCNNNTECVDAFNDSSYVCE